MEMTASEMLTNAEAAALIGISAQTLRQWRYTGRPNQPPVIKLSEGTVRYARRDILQFLSERRRIFAGA